MAVEDLSKQTLQIYPNPSSDYIYVKNSDSNKYEIFDALGRKIKSGNFQEKINIQNLTKGEYILKLAGKNKIYTHKIIKK